MQLRTFGQKLKNKFTTQISGEMSMDKLLRETEKAVNKIFINRWQDRYNHLQKLELKIWKKIVLLKKCVNHCKFQE